MIYEYYKVYLLTKPHENHITYLCIKPMAEESKFPLSIVIVMPAMLDASSHFALDLKS